MSSRSGAEAPALETARLRLVPFATRHLAFLRRLWTDPAVREYLWDDRIVSREEAADVVAVSRRSFATEGIGMWVLVSRRSGRELGFAGLRRFADDEEVEVLYGLLPEAWGKGLATEAAAEVVRYALEEVGLARVWAGADAPNRRSFAVMRRIGMRHHGRRKVAGREAVYYLLEKVAGG